MSNKKCLKKQYLSFVLAVCIFAGGFNVFAENGKASAKMSLSEDNSYFSYYNANSDKTRPKNCVKLAGKDYINGVNVTTENVSEKEAAVFSGEGSSAEWQFEIPETGLYPVSLSYYAFEGSGKDILFSLKFDGVLPFSDSDEMILHRIWKDDADENGNSIASDEYGNDLLPRQIEYHRWSKYNISDSLGLYGEPYMFYLAKGTHILQLDVKQEGVAISRIDIGSENNPESYNSYISKYSESDYVGGDTYTLQAEQTAFKNKSTLYPLSDRSTTATEPYDASHTKLNTIGQGNWSSYGEYITWIADVPKQGLYRMFFRARQCYNEGMNSYRALYINGKIPFKEAENISFKYDSDWYGKMLAGKDGEYYVYLEPGDQITLEVTTGVMSAALRDVQQSTFLLNDLYRKIIVITGTSPDVYRDYSLENKIPELVSSLTAIRKMLEHSMTVIESLIGDKGSQASVINKIIAILKEFEESPYNITAKLSSFKDNIESLGTLVQTLGSQPLELDYISFIPKGEKIPSVKAPWYKDLAYGFSQFIVSFVHDYDQLGSKNKNSTKKSIDVWVSTGRDQAQVINGMITDTFTNNTGIGVNLSMVSTGNILIQATLAGMGPHAALSVSHDEPVNLAMRGALVDLSDPKYNLESIKKEFFASAWIPFEYNGGVYAMPESQGFDMMFYRTDIFEELSIEPPQTWDDFYTVLKVLEENNLQFGILEINSGNAGVSAGISTFDKFLFQNGGSYYTENKDKTLFDTEVAYKAFESWVNLYSRYGLAREFEFYNRFRSGEMPAGIQPYTMYNKLSQAAPEIRGLWSFTPIPGTRQSDGSINRAESSTGTGCIILNRALKDGVDTEAFSFLEWWVSADAQTRYCQELEAMMGTSARGTPANVEAFRRLNWTKDETQTILSQWEHVCNPPQIPGNYTVSRSLTNAFRTALNNNQNARRFLQIYNKDINQEITRKRKEFKLDVQEAAK